MKFTKKSAFLIHLALSFLIFGSLVATLYFFWFPGDLFVLDGGWEGLKLVAMVDLVLGPALTLLLFSPGKKGMKFDMAAIALFQVSALAYGFYATYQQQTVALVFSEGGFNTVSHSGHVTANRNLEELEEVPQKVSQFGNKKPYNIFIEPPTAGNIGKFMVDIFNGYPDPHERSDKYLSIPEHYASLQKHQVSVDTLKSEDAWDEVEATLKATGRNANDFEFYRFKARYARGFVIFSPSMLRIVDYVPIKKPARKVTVQAESDEQG